MQAIISVISGMIGFVIIAGIQFSMAITMKMNSGNNQMFPAVYSIGITTRIAIILLGLIAIGSSISYSSRNNYKLIIRSKVGLFFGIMAILLCFIPLFLYFN